MKVTLSLTHECNLSCKYCYGGKKDYRSMSFETAKKITDYIFEITPDGQKIEFNFFGGEPLLQFDLLQRVVEYIRKKASAADNTVSLGITSNGTLLTSEILNYLKNEGITLSISIDGPEHIHNLNRRFSNGRSSFETVEDGLKLAVDLHDLLQVNAVFSPETVGFLEEIVNYFTDIGVNVIHLNPNISSSWENITFDTLLDSYMRIASVYINSYSEDREMAVNLIDSKIIILIKGGYELIDICGMGKTEWGFSTTGNAYPCERLIGEDDGKTLCLGNIHSGIEVTKQCTLLKEKGNRNEECIDCELKKYCMNWCGCTNFHMTGSINYTGRFMCLSEQAAIHSARHVLVDLNKKNNDLFHDHFMEYLHKKH